MQCPEWKGFILWEHECPKQDLFHNILSGEGDQDWGQGDKVRVGVSFCVNAHRMYSDCNQIKQNTFVGDLAMKLTERVEPSANKIVHTTDYGLTVQVLKSCLDTFFVT